MVSIAERGRLMSSFNEDINLPLLLPALTNTARCAWETLSITDSSKEQRKDINSEIKK